MIAATVKIRAMKLMSARTFKKKICGSLEKSWVIKLSPFEEESVPREPHIDNQNNPPIPNNYFAKRKKVTVTIPE